ncbi:hypothetical protein L484_003012 [Morus notabilis]|uniref:Uncharacterized protein n=1 Tax=Morus notabilis TaxID=981085 RepID=W9R7G2_9ROSA|nr:hypothetical protein L484_003012 [Morus notabilis]
MMKKEKRKKGKSHHKNVSLVESVQRTKSPWAPSTSQPVHHEGGRTPQAIGVHLLPGPHLCGYGPGDFPGPEFYVMQNHGPLTSSCGVVTVQRTAIHLNTNDNTNAY